MKEMLKSKTVIAFVIIILGLVFISTPSNKMEDNQKLNNGYITVERTE